MWGTYFHTAGTVSRAGNGKVVLSKDGLCPDEVAIGSTVTFLQRAQWSSHQSDGYYDEELSPFDKESCWFFSSGRVNVLAGQAGEFKALRMDGRFAVRVKEGEELKNVVVSPQLIVVGKLSDP